MTPYFPQGTSMFKSLLAVVLAAFVAFSPVLDSKPLPSVQPIQYQGKTFCTTFSINEKLGYFVTAGHCAFFVFEKELNGAVTILGESATIVMVGVGVDVAVFQADAHVPGLKLANKPVAVCNPKSSESCETISIQGFPYGLPSLVTVSGHMAAHDVPIIHPSYRMLMYSDILDITVAGGNSGSPVFNGSGEVIGVLWGGFTNSPHSLSVPLDAVRQTTLGYFEAS